MNDSLDKTPVLGGVAEPDGDWLAEAHRRADAADGGGDSTRSIGLAGRARPEFASAAIAGLLAFSWLTARGAGDVASNAWQGLLLPGAELLPAPIVSKLLSELIGTFAGSDTLLVLNLLARMSGAMACAGIAALTTHYARRLAPPFESLVVGVLSGTLFALTPIALSHFTAASPGALTVMCAVWGLVFIAAGPRTSGWLRSWPHVSALLLGMAAANHPFLVWLTVPYLLALIHAARSRRLSVLSGSVAILILAGVLALPLLYRLVQGEPLPVFLAHALRAPYPAIAEAWPDAAVIPELGLQLHPLAWFICLASAVLVTRRETRAAMIAVLCIMAMAGPFAPVFMNQFDAGVFPRDAATLAGVTLAGASFVFGLGLLVATQSLFRASYAPGYRAALSVLAFAVIAVHQWTQAPHRGGGLSGEFAREILNGCPPESVLVTADTEIASMVRAAQHAYGHRPDVTVLPETVLRHAAARQFYLFHQPGFSGLEANYDPQQRMVSWRTERPLVSNEFLEAGEHDLDRVEDARGDLIIWDFVRDNFADRPIAFAGVDVDWLHARATVNGLVQIFPVTDAPLTDSIEAWIALKAAGDVQRRDPELAASISRLLLSQSATRRNQNQGEDATRLARLATGLKPAEPRAWRELARAAARNGLRREANVYSSTFLTFGGHANDSQRLTAAIDRDARVYDLQVRYQVSLRREPEDGLGWIDRQELASALWQEDEIALLAELLEAELVIGRANARNYYEAAAAHAQMGDLERARDHLATAATLSSDNVAERLKEDGRFVLLLHDNAFANESITR